MLNMPTAYFEGSEFKLGNRFIFEGEVTIIKHKYLLFLLSIHL
jgi:hypothetical protein